MPRADWRSRTERPRTLALERPLLADPELPTQRLAPPSADELQTSLSTPSTPVGHPIAHGTVDTSIELGAAALQQDPALVQPAGMVVNEPGQWDVMISYTQCNAVSFALAEKLRAGLIARGLSVWMDVWMKHRHPQAMREGVENSDRIIAIISGDESSGDNAYFKRTWCLQEMRWAKAANKKIRPVVDDSNRGNITRMMQLVPPDLTDLKSVNWEPIIRSDDEHFNVGLNRCLSDSAARRPTKMRTAKKVGAALLILFAVLAVVGLTVFGTLPQTTKPLPVEHECGDDALARAMQHATVACESIEDDGTSSYPAGTECITSCNEGYRAGATDGIAIQETRTCTNGEWSGPLPICVAEPCTSVAAPANAVEDLQCSGSTGDACPIKCKPGYQIGDSSPLICGVDGVFRGTGTCEAINECTVNNGGCFEETGDTARKCAVTPWDGSTAHSCIQCRDGFTRGLGYQTGDFCEPRCTAPVPPPPLPAVVTDSSTAADADGSADSSSSSMPAAEAGGGETSSGGGKEERFECAFPFYVEPGQLGNTWGRTRYFVDCASHEYDYDLPLPDGLPPGSSWCLTDPHDPTTVKQCIDCKGPGGLTCPPLPEPAHGKFVCSEDAPAFDSSCELQCDPGYASTARGAEATVKCGWDAAWHNPSPFGVSESMGPVTSGGADMPPMPTCTQIDGDDVVVH